MSFGFTLIDHHGQVIYSLKTILDLNTWTMFHKPDWLADD